jgi:hypothetical protein
MKPVFVASFLVLAGTYGVNANAQEVKQPSYFEQQMAAPNQAFEIGVSGLYNQGWGNLTDTTSPLAGVSRRVQDLSGPGGGAEIDLGYRFIPELAAGVFVQGSQYSPDARLATGTNVRSLTAGIQGHWFFMPYRTINPWVGLGTAYRGHWMVPDSGGVTQHHGWQIARLQLGIDMRASREVSVGPYIAGSVDTFFSEKLPGQDSRTLDQPAVAGFFGAGLQGRFDVGGSYIAPGGASIAHASR